MLVLTFCLLLLSNRKYGPTNDVDVVFHFSPVTKQKISSNQMLFNGTGTDLAYFMQPSIPREKISVS